MANEHYINIDSTKVPIKLKRERRSSVRYSISKKSINLTLPKFYSQNQIQTEYHKIYAWAKIQFAKNPGILERFRQRGYKQGDNFDIYGQTFILDFSREERKGLSAEIDDNIVCIKYPDDLSQTDLNASLSSLFSRLFSKHFHPSISEKLHHYNDTYFQEEIKSLRLKNNQSNWGSCSSNKNINLSSRLLFAPTEVLDYVIVHELAHLKEMNHSTRFWQIVESVMPDYKSKDVWLTKHGHHLKF